MEGNLNLKLAAKLSPRSYQKMIVVENAKYKETILDEMKNYKQEAIIGSMLLKPLGLAELNKRPVFDNKYHLIATLGKTESSKTYLAQDIKKP